MVRLGGRDAGLNGKTTNIWQIVANYTDRSKLGSQCLVKVRRRHAESRRK